MCGHGQPLTLIPSFCVTYYVGDRGRDSALNFMHDAAERIIGKPQITTDAPQALPYRR